MTKETDALLPAQMGAIGFANRGVMPSDVESLYRYAKIVVKSGLAPAGLDTAEKVVIAAETGVELGLPIQAAIRSIYVVHGVPALKGDAAKALVFNSGLLEKFSEKVEGEGDQMFAIVTVKRKGFEETSRTFSIWEAKRAGLIKPEKKSSAWIAYPERMLKYRALGFILRDVFPDVLLGVHIAEEIDAPTESQPKVERVAPSDPDPFLAALAPPKQDEERPTIAGDERSPGTRGEGTSEKTVPARGAKEEEQRLKRGREQVKRSLAAWRNEHDGTDIDESEDGAAEPEDTGNVVNRDGQVTFLRETFSCPLCGHAQEYDVNVTDASVKDVSVPCAGCGATFPVANPNFVPDEGQVKIEFEKVVIVESGDVAPKPKTNAEIRTAVEARKKKES